MHSIPSDKQIEVAIQLAMNHHMVSPALKMSNAG